MTTPRMKLNFVPLFKTLPKVGFLDDKEFFLKTIKAAFQDKFNCIFYMQTSDAMSGLEASNDNLKNLVKKYLSISINDVQYIEPILDFDLTQLHKIAFEDNGTSILSVLVTDYNMPKESGIDLCRRGYDSKTKKILLTGVASYDQAVLAFNENLINCFIRKDEDVLLDIIEQRVNDLTYEYFQELTWPAYNSLTSKYDFPLDKKEFQDIFYQVVDQNDIVEYYLLDESGSYLMYDKDKTPLVLNVKNEEEMRKLYELSYDDREAPPQTTRALKNKLKIPFFSKPAEESTSSRYWDMFEAKAIHCEDSNYYYSIVGKEYLEHYMKGSD